MKTFEEKTAAAIRSLTITCIVLAGALLIAIGLAALGLANSTSTSAKLKASVQSPTHVKDIADWCNFDVALKHDLDAYIGHFHAPALPLPPLDCAAIEHSSSAAAK